MVGQIAMNSPNEALVRAAQAGDREAFSTLMARHRRTVLAYALTQLGDREEAEDVAQETFVRAYFALRRLRDPLSWEAWLMRIARNLCRDAQRRRQVRRAEPIEEHDPEGDSSPEELALARERRRQVSAAVAELPEKLRVPLQMHYASGCTYREIALALELPESTIVGRLAGALRRLRHRLGVEKPR
jgi:RNA polymerase sigma-70 factor (ECF subfamily)